MNTFARYWNELTWKIPFLQKWGSIRYVSKHYGFPRRQTVEMWARAEREFVPGRDSLLGEEKSVADDFFSAAAHRQHEEAEVYTCVFGCCSVLWYRGKNIGGFGPVGCPCDDMKDPRDLTTKEEK